MIKNVDLEKFRGQYPYGSELFGVYQTLLGWRGARARSWFMTGYARDRKILRDSISNKMLAVTDARPNQDGVLERVGRIDIGHADDQPKFGSLLMKVIAPELAGGNHDDPNFWKSKLTDDMLTAVLNRDVRNEAQDMLRRTDPVALPTFSRVPQANSLQLRTQETMRFIEAESRMAGQLKVLRDNGAASELKQLFFLRNSIGDRINQAAQTLKGFSPFSQLDPENILSDTIISPIGVIHLFRQYFFELDSFLGSPVGHVWVAPHTTVELIEINTRRTVTEQTIDQSSFQRQEEYDESFALEDLHEAVSQSNQQDLSFGASVSGSHSWIVGSVQASSSMNYHTTQSESRLAVHDMMRQQTQRVASLMEKSVHTTFKTVTDVSQISSKKYVVSNPGDDVINYELRRKMRRVAVQVQDIGTYLSWQSFVDDPGRELGIANLVHIAEPPNLANIPHPELIVPKPTKETTEAIQLPFAPFGKAGCDPAGSDDTDQEWTHGIESSIGYLDDVESIQSDFVQKFRAPDKDYRLANVEVTPLGDAQISVGEKPGTYPEVDGYFQFTLSMDYANFHDSNSIGVSLKLIWESREDLNAIKAENDKRMSTFVAKEKRAYEDAYVKAAQERVNQASKISARPYDDLRQEERIAVYRRLVHSLAPDRFKITDDEIVRGKKFSYPPMSDQTRHAWSEILNRIFDMEKMLYFVAPEWWKPRAHTTQVLGAETPVLDKNGDPTLDADGNIVMQSTNRTSVPTRDQVSWGGAGEAGRPNYFITDASAPAKLGSSLGWLLQLDGDSMRNAFLNAPWVKAVIPIRPGREQEAIDWLKGVVEGSEGLDAALEGELADLAKKVAEKHEKAATVESIPDLIDPNVTVSTTPVDKVFEFGFDPLQGGFRAQSIEGGEFEIVDQWIEVVPTDQVAAVAVKYDPATGRQVPIV
jgi:hypothetical protein